LEAVQESNVGDIVRLLPEMNLSEINTGDETGMSALHWSARTGNAEICKLLLRVKGIKVNLQDSIGWTPLHYASNGGFKDVVTLLLQVKGIDVTLKNHQRQTPLEVTHAKEISALLKVAKKKFKLTTEKGGRLQVSSSAILGQEGDIQYSTKSVINSLEQKNFVLSDLVTIKKEVQDLHEKNEKLEKELHKVVGKVSNTLYVEEEDHKFY